MKPVEFDPALRRELAAIKTAEIVVGIPSYNNGKTVGHVVRAVVAGLKKYFPDRKSVLVNSDGGSKDGTPEAVMQAAVDEQTLLLARHPVHPVHRISTPYHGLPGKGSALRTIFQIAGDLDAKACAVVDSDLRSITPEWVELLVRPVLEQNFDYVAPYYLRHKFDGTITNNIVYPLTRALYGRAIRQPIGGDFGFSTRLARCYLGKDVWESDVARFGIDIWMTTVALAEGHRVCQSYLGAKIHDPKDPGADLSEMLVQVVGSVFELMEKYDAVWTGGVAGDTVPMFGFPFYATTEPIQPNLDRMKRAAEMGLRDLAPLYEQFMAETGLWGRLQARASAAGITAELDEDLWSEVVYAFAFAFHRRQLARTHLLKSLTPLYLGRVAHVVSRYMESTAEEVEQCWEQLCNSFSRLKPDFAKRWGR